MGKIKVFLDTDVVISALLSQTGASYKLIKNPKIIKIVSKTVKKEVHEVTKRLNIDTQKTGEILKNIKVDSLNLTKKDILAKYAGFVSDEKDSPVAAGADGTKSKFLLTHNLRRYRVDKIKAELGIIVLNPGHFLQYLRSVAKF